ncbi:MAG TPA: hypothetical protein VN624_12375, partial [Rhodanobacter sp.]|nr:hypothetical protein [Rhodanobacter sp.]
GVFEKLERVPVGDGEGPGDFVMVVAERRQEDMLGHRKLRIDTRLKLLAKWDPKRYGDKQQLEHSGTLSLENLVAGAGKAE